MMIKKSNFLVGGQTGQYPKIFVFMFLKPLFCQSTLTNRLKIAEQVFLGILQHPTKLLTGKNS